MPPRGVLGTSSGWPSASMPALWGVIPSTSLRGESDPATTVDEYGRGIGICTITPCTDWSSLSSWSVSRKTWSSPSAGRAMWRHCMPTRPATRASARTYADADRSPPAMTVTSPGTCPCSEANARTRSDTSARSSAEASTPSRMEATTTGLQ